jgi:hypothetical protein
MRQVIISRVRGEGLGVTSCASHYPIHSIPPLDSGGYLSVLILVLVPEQHPVEIYLTMPAKIVSSL